MFYLIILFLISHIIHINCDDDILCPYRRYWNGNECLDCIANCEICMGSNLGDCEICISDFCKYAGYGCIPCGSIEGIVNKKKTFHLSENRTKLQEVRSKNMILMSYNIPIIFIAMIIGFFVIAAIVLVIYKIIKRLKKSAKNREKCDIEKADYLLKTFSLTFPAKDLNEGRLLLEHKEAIGSGYFGTIFKCPYVDDGKLIWVAIKTTNYTNREPAKELEALMRLSHLNIVQLKAINQKENLILVMPLRQGDLKKFLINEKDKITNYHQIRYCMQISDACRYMINKKIVHCDLKASNILVVNINHIEISDFGKSERLHQGRGKRVLGTLTHAAIELLDFASHAYACEATDVWSFGITMWEIFTFGSKIPYKEEFSQKNVTQMAILCYLLEGKRLKPPETLSPDLYRIMIICWMYKSCDRPTFNQLFHKFSKSLPEASDESLGNILDESIDKTMTKPYEISYM